MHDAHPFLGRLSGSPACAPRCGLESILPRYQALGFTKFEGFSEWATARFDYSSAHDKNEDPHHSFLLDFAVHVIDLVRYLFGGAESVFAFSKEGHAYAVSLPFAGAAVGSLRVFCFCAAREPKHHPVEYP